MTTSDWIALGELFIGIIGIVVGFIGGKELHEANKLKIQFRDLSAKIEKIEVSNSQVAHTINNNGLSLKETEDIAVKIVNENMPEMYLSEDDPKTLIINTPKSKK